MYYLLIIAGGLMTMDTIWLSTVCNGNLGTALPAIMGVPLLLIGLFRGFFIQWFRTPAGHIAKVLLIACYSAAVVFFCCMGAMLGSAARTYSSCWAAPYAESGCPSPSSSGWTPRLSIWSTAQIPR